MRVPAVVSRLRIWARTLSASDWMLIALLKRATGAEPPECEIAHLGGPALVWPKPSAPRAVSRDVAPLRRYVPETVFAGTRLGQTDASGSK
jgi:hypothetical protein